MDSATEQYVKTAVQLAKRKGATEDDIHALVSASFNSTPVHDWVPDGFNLVREPELRDRGIATIHPVTD